MPNATVQFLGTGEAMVTKCYNTCFVVRGGSYNLLVDCGGGNGLLTQLERAGLPVQSIGGLFLTHAHTDHLLGAVWLLRQIVELSKDGLYDGALDVYAHDGVHAVLSGLCALLFNDDQLSRIDRHARFRVVAHGQAIDVPGMAMRFFDIGSTKLRQFGLRLDFACGRTLTYLGDEPYRESSRVYAQGVDWLVHEAFCLASEADRWKPYEKHHATPAQAGRAATGLAARNLVLVHTEDSQLDRRRALYAAEAAATYSGPIHVPDDLDIITI